MHLVDNAGVPHKGCIQPTLSTYFLLKALVASLPGAIGDIVV